MAGINSDSTVTVDGYDINFIWQNDNAGVSNIYIQSYQEDTWSVATALTTSGTARYPKSAMNSDGDLYLAWIDNRSGTYQVYLEYNSDGWGSETLLTDSIISLTNPDIGVSDTDKAIITYHSNDDIYAMSYENGITSQATLISSLAGGTKESSRLIVDPQGIPYVVWADDGPGNYEIYFRTQGS
jgi:hypothetical protein